MPVVCNRWEGFERGWFPTLALVKIKNSNSKAVVVKPLWPARARARLQLNLTLRTSQCHQSYAHAYSTRTTNMHTAKQELDSVLQPVVDQRPDSIPEILFAPVISSRFIEDHGVSSVGIECPLSRTRGTSLVDQNIERQILLFATIMAHGSVYNILLYTVCYTKYFKYLL